MSLVILIELAAKSAVIAAAALTLTALLKNRSAAERSWVAHAGLAAIAGLPAASLLLPRWRLLSPHEAAAGSEPLMAMQATSPPLFDPALVLQGVYLAGAGLLVVATAVAVARLFTLRHRARVLLDAGWLTALARAQERMGMKSGAALLVSDDLTSPVSWGLIRPTIVINPALIASPDDAEAVIAHELAHVVRLDWAKLLMARIVVALCWFNPLVWALARQCHQLREEAADDAVLRNDVCSADYASLLVEAARHECHALIAAHGVAPAKGSLHRRVTRVLDTAARRAPTPAAWALGSLAGLALFAGPLAALTLERAEPAARTIRSAAAVAPVAPTPTVTIRNLAVAKGDHGRAVAATIRPDPHIRVRVEPQVTTSLTPEPRPFSATRAEKVSAKLVAAEARAGAKTYRGEQAGQEKVAVRALPAETVTIGRASIVSQSADGTRRLTVADDGALRIEMATPSKTAVLDRRLTETIDAQVEAEVSRALRSRPDDKPAP